VWRIGHDPEAVAAPVHRFFRHAKSVERLCLDYVSRPDAFARLYPKLLEGYLLDALEVVEGRPAGDFDAFIAAIAEGSTRPAAIGPAGRRHVLYGEGVVASCHPCSDGGVAADDSACALPVDRSGT
jgi:hypothetical protein